MIIDLPFYGKKTTPIILLIFILAIQSSILAQSGTIKGRVFDKETKGALVGANIIIKGTSLGSASDLDGNYIIYNVPEGKHSFIISYLGYNSDTVVVNVSRNESFVKNFYLIAKAIQGQTITITAQAQGQVSALQQQLSSNKIVNIVSEARIQELPDFNAAQALSRLPGISTIQSSGEANKVVIRGLGPQYNEVAIGGITLASTGSSQIGATSQGGTSGAISNDRSVDLTMVTPYMIKSIQVYKSLTPDMNADAIGGYVNMDLREAPSGFHGDVLWQSGYTQKNNQYGNYRFIGSSSDRFFNNMLGVYALVNAESYDRNADNMSAAYSTYSSTIDTTTGYRPIQVNTVTLDRHIETRKRYGANLILDYKLPNGTLKFTNMFSSLISDYQDYNEGIDYRGNGINFTYRSGENTTNLGSNTLRFQNDFGFMSVDINAAYTYSTNSLPNSPFYQFRQTGGVVQDPTKLINAIPQDVAASVSYLGNANYLSMGGLSLLSSHYKEFDKLVRSDFKVPLNLGTTISGFIKFGGEYRRDNHTNNQHTPYAGIDSSNSIQRLMLAEIRAQGYNIMLSPTGRVPASQFTSGNQNLFGSFLGDQFGKMFWVLDPSLLNKATNFIQEQPNLNAVNNLGGAVNPGGWFDGLFQLLPNNYMYYENYSAAYAMSELDLGSKAMIVGGVRFEQVTSDFTAYNLRDSRSPATQPAFAQEVTVHPSNKFFLPMIQGKYDVADWLDVRYSYTQTLARPDYSELSPHYNIGYGGGPVWSGNPNLKTAQAYNHDLELTFHSNELGLLSVGGFYKEIKNFTYPTSYNLYNPGPGIVIPPGLDSISSFSSLGSPPTPGTTLYTYVNNRYIAYVRGVETDFETRLWYLPFPFNGLLLGINYTHIWSQTEYPLTDLITSGRPPRQSYRLVDSSRAGRLIYQPNDIVNAYLGYDYEGFSARISCVYQGNSVSYIGNYPEQDGFTENYFRVDFSARQMLPWKGLQIYIDANNLNNENNISAQSSIGGFTSDQNYGITADLGIRLTL
ncbi:MAG: TonB-dependent receptor [Ignavibacteriaceae bacterium]